MYAPSVPFNITQLGKSLPTPSEAAREAHFEMSRAKMAIVVSTRTILASAAPAAEFTFFSLLRLRNILSDKVPIVGNSDFKRLAWIGVRRRHRRNRWFAVTRTIE